MTAEVEMAATGTQKDSDAPRVHPDAKRSRLRTIMGALDRELEALSAAGGSATVHASVLRVTWKELATALDLGPERAVNPCPGCGATGFADAIRCGECWIILIPEATD